MGDTDLDVFPLCLGGNVFGWTIDEQRSFEVLDAYFAAGGNFIDTADTYGRRGPAGAGSSEQIIGAWMAARGNREELVIATKVGMSPDARGLSAENIRGAIAASLERLQTDRVDLYYAHQDDPQTSLEETLGAFAELIEAGSVRHVAASNYSPVRLEQALRIGEQPGMASFVALQPHYNLLERDYEHALMGVCERNGLACFPYFGLARGFLTGKYRPGARVESPRAAGIEDRYLNDRGFAVLAALEKVAAAHAVAPAAVGARVAAGAPHRRGAARERHLHRAARSAAFGDEPRAVGAGGRAAERGRRSALSEREHLPVRITHRERAVPPVHVRLRCIRQRVLQRFECLAAELELHAAQARGVLRRGLGAGALPGVEPHVMVVAARREERRRGQPRLLLEPQCPSVEVDRPGHVRDLQVDVADDGARGDLRVRGGRPLCEQILDVERQGVHVQAAPVGGGRPPLAGPVGVELDAEAVGVAQVERLRDAVVGGALEAPARLERTAHGGGERGTRRMQPGDVVEACAVR